MERKLDRMGLVGDAPKREGVSAKRCPRADSDDGRDNGSRKPDYIEANASAGEGSQLDAPPSVIASPWPNPLPLEGVKSRKRAIFGVEGAEIAIGGNVSRVSSVKLTLESRIVAVSDVGRAIVEVLCGDRTVTSGKANLKRHDGLVVAHLGPHIAKGPDASVEQYASAVVDVLQMQPHVIILDEAFAADDVAWAQSFAALLGGEAIRSFRGAVVICVAEESESVVQVCSERWTGAAGWAWQEMCACDTLEILDDVLANGKDFTDLEILLKDVSELSDLWFSEDSVAKAQDKDWKVALLVEPALHGRRNVCAFACYLHSSLGCNSFTITRLAVQSAHQKRGYGSHLMNFLLVKAARIPRSECGWVALSALDTAVPFYERYGFFDMTCGHEDDSEVIQTWMELQNKSVAPERLQEEGKSE